MYVSENLYNSNNNLYLLSTRNYTRCLIFYLLLASALLNNYYEILITEEIVGLGEVVSVFPFSTPAEIIRYLITG